jgi:hypothetical protein
MLGSARRNWLAQNQLQDDEEDVLASLGPALDFIADLMKDAAKARAFLDKATTAAKTLGMTRAAVSELETARRKAESDITAVTAEIARVRAAHEAAMAKREALVSATEKQVANSLQQAKLDAKAAADLKAEAKRRLDRVEAAING